MQRATEREGTPTDEKGRRHTTLFVPLLPVTPLNDVITVMFLSLAASYMYSSAGLTVN